MMIEALEARRMLAVDVSIDASKRFQTIDGFGTSLAWWAPQVYQQTAWQDAYFKDLGSSMLRVDLNILALPGSDGDLATPVTFGEDLQANINQFDWNSVPTKVFGGVIQSAAKRKIDSFKVIGSIWTPPQWMKGPQLVAGKPKLDPQTEQPLPVLKKVGAFLNSVGGTLIDTAANLQQFGRYVAAYVKGYEQHFGVAMDALSIQNEPAFDQVGTSQVGFNSCLYDPATFVKALKAVDDAFAHYHITTKVMGPEATAKDELRFVDAIQADAAAKKKLDLYNIHGSVPSSVWNDVKNDGKKLWMTETSGEAPTWDGALSVARNAQSALIQGNVSAWLYWQMSDGGTSASGTTLTNAANTAAPKYAAAKHFFRYVRAGAVRVSATPGDPNGVSVSAFVQDQQHTLTSVIVNETSAAQTLKLHLAGAHVAKFNIVRQSSSSGVWKDLGAITLNGDSATINLPAKAVLTLQGTTAAQWPFRAGPFVVGKNPLTIQAEDFDNGGEGVAYHDLDAINSGGKYRSGGVDIQTTADAGGGYNIGYIKAGEWLQYSIHLDQGGSFDFDFRLASTGTGGKFHFEIDGVNKSGALTVPRTGGYQSWQTLRKSSVPLTAGDHVLRVKMDANSSTGSVGNFNWIKISPH